MFRNPKITTDIFKEIYIAEITKNITENENLELHEKSILHTKNRMAR